MGFIEMFLLAQGWFFPRFFLFSLRLVMLESGILPIEQIKVTCKKIEKRKTKRDCKPKAEHDGERFNIIRNCAGFMPGDKDENDTYIKSSEFHKSPAVLSISLTRTFSSCRRSSLFTESQQRKNEMMKAS